MKTQLLAIAALLPALIVPVSCDDDSLDRSREQGRLVISFVKDNSLYSVTKAGGSAIPDTNDFILTVTGSSGRVIYEGTYGAAPEVIITDPGSYTVGAVSRTFSEPLFDAPQYGDTQVVTVSAGKTANVVLECSQQNAGVKLNINSDFLVSYPNGSLFLKSSKGKLLYGYSEKRTAFFLPGAVSLVINEGAEDKILFTRNLEAQQMLVVNVSAGVSEATEGAVSISVDTCRNWTSENYVIGSGSSDRGDEIGNAMTVTQARGNAGANDVWVYGYIVGGDLSSSRCSFTPPFSSRTNIVIAAKSSCSDKQACMSVQLSQGDIRDALNLVDHPDNLGRQIYLKGDIVSSYYGIPGLQSLSEYKWK